MAETSPAARLTSNTDRQPCSDCPKHDARLLRSEVDSYCNLVDFILFFATGIDEYGNLAIRNHFLGCLICECFGFIVIVLIALCRRAIIREQLPSMGLILE